MIYEPPFAYLAGRNTVLQSSGAAAGLHVHVCPPPQQKFGQRQHRIDTHYPVKGRLAIHVLGIHTGTLVQPELQDGHVLINGFLVGHVLPLGDKHNQSNNGDASGESSVVHMVGVEVGL